MIKGCTKRVVVVRDVDSSFFEEAFFIVRPRETQKSESEYLGEAKNLMKTGFSQDGCSFSEKFSKKGSFIKKTSKIRDFFIFLSGFCFCALISFFIYYSGILF